MSDINEIIDELNSKEAGAQKVIADLQTQLAEARDAIAEFNKIVWAQRERVSKLKTQLAAAREENKDIRKMLAFQYSGDNLYFDDGELQDNSKKPFIDFKRDKPIEIRNKFLERGLKEFCE